MTRRRLDGGFIRRTNAIDISRCLTKPKPANKESYISAIIIHYHFHNSCLHLNGSFFLLADLL
jgi:hypothetical protein